MHTLCYTEFRPDGVFGTFTFDGDAKPFMVTLSHAYKQEDGTYRPVVREGVYNCVRGVHRLANLRPFETFEIEGIEGHDGLLFHAGNYNKDSHGCTLCGEAVAEDGNIQMITNSRMTFSRFMARLDGVDSFQLKVTRSMGGLHA